MAPEQLVHNKEHLLQLSVHKGSRVLSLHLHFFVELSVMEFNPLGLRHLNHILQVGKVTHLDLSLHVQFQSAKCIFHDSVCLIKHILVCFD